MCGCNRSYSFAPCGASAKLTNAGSESSHARPLIGRKELAGGQEVGNVDELDLRLGHSQLLANRSNLVPHELLELVPRLPHVGDLEPATGLGHPMEQTARIWILRGRRP